MKLLKVRFENFRIIQTMDWIPIKKLMILTGENDGGKTSTLNALEIFLNQKAAPHSSDYRKIDGFGNSEGKISMYGIFSLDPTEQSLVGTPTDSIEVRREFGTGIDSSFMLKTMVHSDSRLQGNWTSKTIDQLKIIATELGINLTNKVKKDSIIQDIRNWIATQPLVEGWSPLPKDLLEKMPIVKIFASSKASDLMGEITDTLKASFQSKIKAENYSGKLKEITKQIEADMRGELDQFQGILLKYCPDIASVEITPQFDFTRGFTTTQFSLTKKEGDNVGVQIDLEKEGEGRKRKITLAIYEWRKILLTNDASSIDQTIIGFDEPDTHLDYSSQRMIFDIIRAISMSGNNHVIVCTHSLNLIDRIPITDILLYHVEHGNAKVKMIDTNEQQLLDAFLYEIGDNIGLRNSTILYERCFLVVEGYTEIDSLPILFNLKYGYPLQSAGIKLLNGHGSSGVNVLSKYLIKEKRNVIFMIDSDTKKSPKSRYFTPESLKAEGVSDNQVLFIGESEFEDAFSDELYLNAANQFWKRYDGKDWSIEDFKKLRLTGDFADNLLKLLRASTHTCLSKQDVGRDLARSMQRGSDIPGVISECFENAHALANAI